MNYEEKYKRAIERAQKLSIDGFLDAVAISDIFPELKESKDEKIKREIVAYINELADLKNEKIPTKWLAWLEKQGEKKSAEGAKKVDVRTMAAWQSGYKEAIEKACEWLEENMNDVGIWFMRGDEIKDIVDLFRKAMKGGEK